MINEYYANHEKYLDLRRDAEIKRLILQAQRANRVRNRQISIKSGLKSKSVDRQVRRITSEQK